MARRLPREPGVRAAPAWRSPEKAGQRPGSGRGGGRAAAASRDGPSGAVDTSLAGPGGGAAPARRSSPPRPAPGRAAPGRTARTPAARGALGPCHGASPRAAATPGREATGAREARSGEAELSRRGPASAPKPSAPAARGPRVPSALGRRRSARCYSPHSLGPQRARTPTPTRSAPPLSGRARAPPPLSARSRGRTLRPRARALGPLGWPRGGSPAPAAGGVMDA